ncbi:hypothetical protein ACFYNO_34945 [Kitasatospora sp. NPDC006697]|uniref:hypothetical protein n=1 Tax=Kitasatospora sp. NPDC006697 TaxID=3364020 RepID=UPI0036843815
MNRLGYPSWSINGRRWGDLLHYPLWLRAVERIDVPAGGLVPGPLDIADLPGPSAAEADPALGDQWREWWQAAVLEAFAPRDEEHLTLPGAGVRAPDFDDLPDPLRELARRRWDPALLRWHEPDEFDESGAPRSTAPDGGKLDIEGDVVRAVEAEIGQRAEPFVLSLHFLVVADEEIRRAGPREFLVPERLRGTEQYRRWLHGLVRAIA